MVDVQGEGVHSIGADTWQSASTSGSGVEVGVIDLGFDGYAQAKVLGELPLETKTADFCPPGQFDASGSEHGTAVAEIVHDVAPAANLHLICIGSLYGLSQAEQYAKDQNLDILVESLGSHGYSRGDGTDDPESALAADARAHGILWIASAGNEGQRHWSGTFSDDDADGWLNFSTADNWNSVGYVLPGEEICVDLKWDDWPTSARNYDLFLGRRSDFSLVAGSTTAQVGQQPPSEHLCYTNPGPLGIFDVLIRHVSGSNDRRLDLYVHGSDFAHQVAEGSVAEPASFPSVMAAGAACWSTESLEPFSSRGPTIVNRIKPDVTGPDRVSGTVYGPFDSCGGSGGFAGTSAAAPHVAGAAALALQANPASSPDQLQTFLESRALDQGALGKDNLWGAGFLALGAAPPIPPLPPVNLAVPVLAGEAQEGNSVNVTSGAWSNAAGASYSYRWKRCDLQGFNCSTISDATGFSYTVRHEDLGYSLEALVRARTNGGAASATSTPAVVKPKPVPPATSALPAIADSAAEGQPVTGSLGTWSGSLPITFAPKWQRWTGTEWLDISGATATTYVPTAADQWIRLFVTASNAAGSASASSNAAPVQHPPVQTGSPQPPPNSAESGSNRPARPRAARCRVPSLVGKTLPGARKLLRRSHCRLGRVTRQSGRGNPGKIIRQSPRPGKLLRSGAPVAVTVKARRR
jgi:subtilisin family serine protease